MDKNILVSVLKNGMILISKVSHSKTDTATQGDLILENVAIYKDGNLTKWLNGIILSNTINIYSDDILTLSTPSDSIIKKYLELFEVK